MAGKMDGPHNGGREGGRVSGNPSNLGEEMFCVRLDELFICKLHALFTAC